MRRSKTNHLRWFNLHSWIGLKLSVLMTFILATGTLAVVSHEIDWLLNGAMRSSAGHVAEPAFGAALDSAQHAFPGARIISLQHHADPWFALEAVVESPWGERGRLWFDPASGAFQGFTRWDNVQRFLRTVHRHLMLPVKIGVPVVTSLAFPLLLSLIAGLIVYKGFCRGFFRMPRFGRTTRIWAGDLHRLVGLWSIWFLLLIVITSVWYFVESLGGGAPAYPKPKTRAMAMYQPTPAELDAMVSTARSLHSGLQVRRVLLPARAGAPLLIMGDLEATLVRPRANTVAFDPANQRVLDAWRGEELSLHARIAEAADPLHFGYFGGLWTKVLWFAFGAAMTALSVTGCVIYGKRIARHYRGTATRALAARVSSQAHP